LAGRQSKKAKIHHEGTKVTKKSKITQKPLAVFAFLRVLRAFVVDLLTGGTGRGGVP